MIKTKAESRADADRTIVHTRVLDAPRDRVFEAWTRPEHIDRWWGPDGFETQTSEMAFEPGGVWRFTMRHPQYGTFPNKITYREIARPERLTYEHGPDGDGPQPPFFVTVEFIVEAAGKTRVTMNLTFPTADAAAQAKRFGAEEGGKQTLARLAELLGASA